MTSYLVDTSIIIDYLRGKDAAVELLDNIEGELFSSYVCLAEIYEGVYRVKNSEEMAGAVTKFFSSLSGMYGVDEKIGKKFGRIRADLKRRGSIIEDLDLLLVATCLVYDLKLITLNKKHFARVGDLRIY